MATGHWATGLNLHGLRTSADGEVWAFREWDDAKTSLMDSMRETEEEYRDAISALNRRQVHGYWYANNNTRDYGITYHDRPAGQCRECVMVDPAIGYPEAGYPLDEPFNPYDDNQ